MGFVAVCWTVLLDGNVDLSVTMSIINTQLFMGSKHFHVSCQQKKIKIVEKLS